MALLNTKNHFPTTETQVTYDRVQELSVVRDPNAAMADTLHTLAFAAEDNLPAHVIDELKQKLAAETADLLAHTLPAQDAKRFGLSARVEQDDYGFYGPPSLRDVYMLAQSYDVLHDETIRDALEHIIDTQPPAFSESLAVALDRAGSDHSLMDTLNDLHFRQDNKLDRLHAINMGYLPEDDIPMYEHANK